MSMESSASPQPPKRYHFLLFVAGASLLSSNAVEVITRMCETHVKGDYELEVIDIYRHPELARKEQIIAVPTLIMKTPVPLRKFIGDLSRIEGIVSVLKEG